MHVLALILSGLWVGGSPPATTAPAGPVLTMDIPDTRIGQLLERLNHPSFDVRRQATEQLSHLDPNALPMLVGRYRSEARHEMKLRLRYIIEAIFHRQVIQGRDGFLGILISRQVELKVTDPTTGQQTPGVAIVTVYPGFAAKRAGMMDNDVIIMFDGQPAPPDETSESFIKLVSSRPPGSVNSVRVLRPAESSREVTVAVPDEPAKTLEGVDLGFCHQGLRVVSVAPGSPAAARGLKVNQIIHKVNGADLAGNSAMPERSGQLLGAVLKAARPGEKLTLSTLEVTAVPLTATLGARPVEMIQEPRDWAEAQARFVHWWQEQGGEVLRPDPNSRTGQVFVQVGPPPVRPPEVSVLP